MEHPAGDQQERERVEVSDPVRFGPLIEWGIAPHIEEDFPRLGSSVGGCILGGPVRTRCGNDFFSRVVRLAMRASCLIEIEGIRHGAHFIPARLGFPVHVDGRSSADRCSALEGALRTPLRFPGTATRRRGDAVPPGLPCGETTRPVYKIVNNPPGSRVVGVGTPSPVAPERSLRGLADARSILRTSLMEERHGIPDDV